MLQPAGGTPYPDGGEAIRRRAVARSQWPLRQYHQVGARPVRSPRRHSLAGTTGAAGNLRHPRRGRLEEDDAEPLLLESEPPVAASHDEHVRRTDQARQVVIGHRAEQAGGRAGLGHPGRKPIRVPAAAGDGHGEIGERSAAGGRPRPSTTSMPLRGTRRLTLTTRGPPTGKPKSWPGPRPAHGGQRRRSARGRRPAGSRRRRHAGSCTARRASAAG